MTGGDQREHEHRGTRRRTAMTTRTHDAAVDDWRSKRSGRRRSTSTNTTVDIVSTATCVSARSGAPDRTNRAAIA